MNFIFRIKMTRFNKWLFHLSNNKMRKHRNKNNNLINHTNLNITFLNKITLKFKPFRIKQLFQKLPIFGNLLYIYQAQHIVKQNNLPFLFGQNRVDVLIKFNYDKIIWLSSMWSCYDSINYVSQRLKLDWQVLLCIFILNFEQTQHNFGLHFKEFIEL